MAAGFHVGAQLHASINGEVVVDAAMGLAAPGVDMRTDTVMPWFSCTKLATSIAVAQQWERGELDLDDPVRSHIRAFTGGGRDAITIRHLLTHTAGLRPADGPPELMRTESWDEAVARVIAAEPEPDWVPGRRAGYHLRGSFFLLGEIVRLLDGRPFDEYVKAEIFEPLGMADSWLSLEPERYQRYGDGRRMGVMHDTSGREPRPLASSHVHCVPGGSGIGPAAELVRMAELLLDKGGALLTSQTAEAMVARHRVDLVDETFGQRIDWGLGVMVNSWYHEQRPAPYGYGDHASARAFGHGGVQSSLCFADPEHGLTVALICNGMPGEAANHRRTQPVLNALYGDLALVG